MWPIRGMLIAMVFAATPMPGFAAEGGSETAASAAAIWKTFIGSWSEVGRCGGGDVWKITEAGFERASLRCQALDAATYGSGVLVVTRCTEGRGRPYRDGSYVFRSEGEKLLLIIDNMTGLRSPLLVRCG